MRLDRFLSVAMLTATLSACDTREDYFLAHCEEPVITLYSGNDSTLEDKRYITVQLGWDDTLAIDYSIQDQYGEIVSYQVQTQCTYNPRGDNYYWTGSPESAHSSIFGDPTLFSERLTVEIDETNHRLLLVEKTNSAESFYTYSKNEQSLFNTDSISFEATMTVEVFNKLGKKGSVNVFLKMMANKPPVADCQLEAVSGESSMHRRIVAQCSDPDQDPIVAYEYCIDGRTIGYGSIYEIRDVRTSGLGSYNGTYITRTALSSVNHVFQETGAHTISIRCQDVWKNWSAWTTHEVIIE